MPFLDGLLQGLCGIFLGNEKDCISEMFLIPSHLQNLNNEANNVRNFYSSDVPVRSNLDNKIDYGNYTGRPKTLPT